MKVCYFWRPPVVGNQRPDSDMISTINPGPWPQSTPEHWQVMTRMIFTVIMMVTSLVMADVTFPETPVVKRGKTVRVAEDTGDISITLRSGVRLWLLGHNQYFNIDHCIVFQKHYFSIRLFIYYWYHWIFWEPNVLRLVTLFMILFSRKKWSEEKGRFLCCPLAGHHCKHPCSGQSCSATCTLSCGLFSFFSCAPMTCQVMSGIFYKMYLFASS